MVIKMNVPKLRFKEFEEEWKKNKLGHLCTFAKGNGLSKSDLSNEGKECILYGELYTTYSEIIRKINSYTDKDSSSFIYSKFNDVLIPASGETPIEIAKASCILKENVILGGDLNILSPKNMDGRFLAYQIGSSRKLEFANLSQGHSVVHLYGDKIKNVNIYYPSPKEQEKISNTLELLDKKIELQSKKIEALKLYKKGLINLVKNDWKNFKNYKINDIFKITRGVVIPKNKLSEEKNEIYKYPVYSSQTSNNGILGYDKIYDYDGKYLTWTTDGANAGKVFYRDGKFRCTNVCGILYEDKPLFTNEFVCELLNYETPKHVSYVGNPKLMNNVMENIDLKLPNNDILIKTSKLISLFNKKLENETTKLMKLHNLKKGLIQNMFV